MSVPTPSLRSLFLPGVEANPQPGVYRDLIAAAQSRGVEYSKIWDLFAFQEDFTVHLARFTHGVLRQPGDDQRRVPRADRRLHLVSERVRVLHQRTLRCCERVARR